MNQRKANKLTTTYQSKAIKRGKSESEHSDLKVPRKNRLIIEVNNQTSNKWLHEYICIITNKHRLQIDLPIIKECAEKTLRKVDGLRKPEVVQGRRQVKVTEIADKPCRSQVAKRANPAAEKENCRKRRTIAGNPTRPAAVNLEAFAESLESSCNFHFGKKRKSRFDACEAIARIQLDSGRKKKISIF